MGSAKQNAYPTEGRTHCAKHSHSAKQNIDMPEAWICANGSSVTKSKGIKI